jgi:hypothetical protein
VQHSLLLATALCTAGCAPLSATTPRAAKSSLGCMQTALDRRELAGQPDHIAHCIAAGVIAWRCSPTEALLAGTGKEFVDLFGPGDASWRDVRADRRGLRCAHGAQTMQDIERCCRGE